MSIPFDDVDDVVDGVVDDAVVVGVPVEFKICVTLWADVKITVTVEGDSDSVVKVSPVVVPVVVDKLSLCVDDNCKVVTIGLLVLLTVDVVVVVVKDWFGV